MTKEAFDPRGSHNHDRALTTSDVSIGRIASSTITYEEYLAGATVIIEPDTKTPKPADPAKYWSGPASNIDSADPRLMNNRSGVHYSLAWDTRMNG